ncbi:PAS domain-containing protein [Uliginosibacterium sp. H1]|uniref:PAS domain-containing protein n=1 Tax=Uliginosibacterium sp. H1 TaxID=3114757 RepID=UPI002E1794B6|nr:PAS domain-containing protein [Uliginosibacterium sp. H1]
MKGIVAFRWNSATGRVFVSDEAWTLMDLPPAAPPTTLAYLFQRALPFDQAEIGTVLATATRDHTGFDYEWRFLMRDEAVKVVRVSAQPVTAESGCVEHVGLINEVMDAGNPLVQGAAELQKARAEAKQFHLTVDQAPGLLWSALPNGFVDFLNQRWLEYTGTRMEDSAGWGWQVTIHPDDRSTLVGAWQRVLSSARAGEAKARLRRHDGSYRWFLFRAMPFHDAEGRLVKWYGQSIDIEDLKRAEDLLAAERTVLEMLARSASLEATLDATCRRVDAMLQGCTASVWLLDEDGSTVSDFMAPGLPRAFIDDLNALIAATGNGKMSLYAGPCATAIQKRKTIVIPDITHSKGWLEYCEVAIPFGFKAVVCAPITSSQDEMLGMFVLQSREVGEPTPYQSSIVEHFTHLAALAIERKHMDRALADSEERFRRMAETTPDVIWITDLHPERVLYCSPSFEQLWGHTVEELYRDARLWTSVIHRDDIGMVVETFTRGIHGKGSSAYNIEFRLQRADGSIRWINERAAFIANGDASPHRVSGISTDVTQRKLAEEALQESQERFALAVSASSDGIWDWDIQRGTVFMSEQAQVIFGIPVGETTRPREAWRQVYRMHPEDFEAYQDLQARYLAGKVPDFGGDWRLMNDDGTTRWVRLRGRCLRDASGAATRMIGSISDINVQKRTESALQQARRLEAMGTLAGGIAHDFNNILGVILGYGEMALRGAASGSRLRRDLDNIMSAGERGRSLVDRILAFSRSGSIERVAVHVEAVVQESLDLLEATRPRHIRIHPALDAGVAAMQGDPTQIHQVVMNLVTNAMQAMPAGGTIDVTLGVSDASAALIITTGVLPPGRYIVLQVADTGSGIAPEVLERIFDPFFTTKEVGVGCGLGLSLVHGIVLNVGGGIDVRTVPDMGSTFAVYLPWCGEAEAGSVDTRELLPQGRGERVLLVDDEEALLRLTEETLQELGYAPSSFGSSLIALEAFRQDPAGFDAVLTDERMPGMTGTALIEQVRRMRPEIPVLLMSGYIGDLAARQSEDFPPDRILKKPLALADLAHSLAEALDREG